jgi:hypothetical protein
MGPDNVTMTTPEPRTRRCEACGYRFRVSGDEVFCSALCAGQAGMAEVIDALKRFAATPPATPGQPLPPPARTVE